jgi:hypothetical protein
LQPEGEAVKTTQGDTVIAALKRRTIDDCRWMPIPRWENYEVSNAGHVRRIDSGKVLTQFVTYNGYFSLRLSRNGKGKTFYVHRLVLLAFVGSPSAGQQTRHLDGDRLNNDLGNLCYGTAKENADDKKRHGTLLIGDAHGMATISDYEAVAAIHRAKETSLKKEALLLGLAPSTLSMIRRGVNRPHLAPQLVGTPAGHDYLTTWQVVKVKR